MPFKVRKLPRRWDLIGPGVPYFSFPSTFFIFNFQIFTHECDHCPQQATVDNLWQTRTPICSGRLIRKLTCEQPEATETFLLSFCASVSVVQIVCLCWSLRATVREMSTKMTKSKCDSGARSTFLKIKVISSPEVAVLCFCVSLHCFPCLHPQRRC